MSGQDEIAGTFLVDGHAHHHAGFATAPFLDSASANFAAAAAQVGHSPAACWLLLAELPRDHWFEALRSGDVRPSAWRVETTAEAESLILHGPDLPPLIVLAGRQIATREGIEVLALGTAAKFADGDDLARTVAAVRSAGALPVLPWGVGKWWGHRGAIVRHFLDDHSNPLFLGDNGGRPALFPTPSALATAARRGITVLPGSDPLPLASETGKVARYGFLLRGTVERARPAAGLRRLLGALRGQPETFGRLEGIAAFVAKQLAMQWKKHGARVSEPPSPRA